MVKGIQAVFQKGRLLFLFIALTFAASIGTAQVCADFLKTQPPPVEGRLVSMTADSMNFDQNGLLGGVHFTEALPASMSLKQIGVRYADSTLELLVSEYIVGLPSALHAQTYLSGQIINEKGELILLISKMWEKAGFDFDPESAQVIEFKPLSD